MQKRASLLFTVPLVTQAGTILQAHAFKKVIMEGAAFEMPILDKTNFVCVNKGIAKGELIGGNLTVLSGIVGSKYLPSFKNKILVFRRSQRRTI
jgi:muramoyltetrapeptide carboxypeptidase LdcA involved in peptidoglycan recycling